jgi:hypothetical protein
MTELLQRLNSAGARYLLIGGQAMRLLGMPRYSMDWGLLAKTAAGRPQDQVDITFLEELKRLGKLS